MIKKFDDFQNMNEKNNWLVLIPLLISLGVVKPADAQKLNNTDVKEIVQKTPELQGFIDNQDTINQDTIKNLHNWNFRQWVSTENGAHDTISKGFSFGENVAFKIAEIIGYRKITFLKQFDIPSNIRNTLNIGEKQDNDEKHIIIRGCVANDEEFIFKVDKLLSVEFEKTKEWTANKVGENGSTLDLNKQFIEAVYKSQNRNSKLQIRYYYYGDCIIFCSKINKNR